MKRPSVALWWTWCVDDVRTLLTCDEKVSCNVSAGARRKLDCAERQQVEPTVGRKVTHLDFQSARFIETSGSVPLRPAPVPLGDEDSDGRQEPSRRRSFLAERGSFLCKRSPVWVVLARSGAFRVRAARSGTPAGGDGSMLVPYV